MGFTRYDAATVLDIRHETARRHPTARRKQNRQSETKASKNPTTFLIPKFSRRKSSKTSKPALEQFRETAADLGADVLNREIAINCSGDPVNRRVGSSRLP